MILNYEYSHENIQWIVESTPQHMPGFFQRNPPPVLPFGAMAYPGLAGHDFGLKNLGVIRAVSEFALRHNATIRVQTETGENTLG